MRSQIAAKIRKKYKTPPFFSVPFVVALKGQRMFEKYSGKTKEGMGSVIL